MFGLVLMLLDIFMFYGRVVMMVLNMLFGVMLLVSRKGWCRLVGRCV